MEEADLAPPDLSQQNFRFVVTLRKTPIYNSETRQWLKQFVLLNCSREQRRVLAFAHSRERRFTSREIQKRFDLDIYASSQLIHSLLRKNIARLVEKGGRVYEVISPQEAEVLPTDLQVLLSPFETSAKLTNKDLQRIWDVSYRTAHRRARALIDTGWLEPQGAGRGLGYRLAKRAQNMTT